MTGVSSSSLPRRETDEDSPSALTYAGRWLMQALCLSSPARATRATSSSALDAPWLPSLGRGACSVWQSEETCWKTPEGVATNPRQVWLLPSQPQACFSAPRPPQSSITSREPSTAQTLCLRPLEARSPRPRCRQGRFLVRAVRENVLCLL